MKRQMASRKRWKLAVCGVAALLLGIAHAQNAPTPPSAPLFKVKDKRLGELSGLAASRAYPGCFWANNDSGDTARLFLLNAQGETVAVVNLQGVEARDWEDITLSGGYLYVGDIGDNFSVMDAVVVHRFREPKLDPQKLGQELNLLPGDRETMTLRYPDGAHDAESLAATPDGHLLIVSKSLSGSNFYASAAPFIVGGNATLKEIVGDFRSGSVGFATKLATGADFSTDGRKLAVCTYAQVYEFSLITPFDASTVKQQEPHISDLPPLRQCESVCYSPDGKSLFVSSEGKNAPLYEMKSTF